MKNVAFKDQQKSWSSGVPTDRDPTFSATDTSDQIKDFLERPVRIDTQLWAYESELEYEFNPWTAFFEDARVINRLVNFRNLRGELGVKFMINGNPYYYGRLMASYRPLHNHDNRTIHRPGNIDDRVEASQRPHVFIDPNTSEGGELCLPFFWFKNSVSIPDKEWRNLGLVNISTLARLRHANENRTPLTISIYVYGKNITLSTPTSHVGAISPQANERENDEYGKISHPAHSVANWAGYLSEAPIIGPFARATQMIAGGIGGLAQLFGYSRPRDLTPRGTYVYRAGGEMSIANAPTQVTSLGIDNKKEVSIDPRVTGLDGTDDMALIPLAKRESYLTNIVWDPSQPIDTHLMTFEVSPLQGRIDANEYHVAPSAWVSLPFEYWKGTMRFRFSIVSSAFHRGRLKFVWDPDFIAPGLEANFNTNYTTIVDITNQKDFTIEVGWGQSTSYLPVGHMSNFPSYSESARISKSAVANGTLSVYVVNELTSPGDLMPIEILVFTSMMDDFEIASPSPELPAIEIVDTGVDPVAPDPPAPIFIPPVYDPPADDTTPPEPDEDQPRDVIFNDPTLVPGLRTPWPAPSENAPKVNWDNLYSFMPMNAEYYYHLPKFTGFTKTKLMVEGRFLNANWTGPLDIIPSIKIEGAEVLEAATITAEPGEVVRIETFQDVDYGTSEPNYLEAVIKFQEPDFDANFVIDKIGYTVPDKVEWTVIKGMEITGTSIADCTVQSTVDGLMITTAALDAEWTIDLPGMVDESHVHTVFDLETSGDVGYSRFSATGPWRDWSVVHTGTGNDNRRMVTMDGTAKQEGVASEGKVYLRTDHNLRFLGIGYWKDTTIIPESHEIHPEANEMEERQNDDTENQAPELTETEDRLGEFTTGALVNQVHFGEQIPSWRLVIKRYQGVRNSQSLILGDLFSLNNHLASSLVTHIIDYVRAGYVGYRGSLRYKIFSTDFLNSRVYGSAYRAHAHSYSPQFDSISRAIVAPFSGTTMENMALSGVLDFEVPYYSLLRFYPARSTSTELDELNGFKEDTVIVNTPGRSDILMSAGEDFACYFFLCTPLLRQV